MSGCARVAGRPIHALLVPLPIGLFVFSFIADLFTRYGGGGEWPVVALYCMGGGIAGAGAAAIYGYLDLRRIGERRVRRGALAHMALAAAAVTLYLFNFALRWQGHSLEGAPFTFSAIAVVLLLAAVWLGARMVYVEGVAVARAVERRRERLPVARERRLADGAAAGGR